MTWNPRRVKRVRLGGALLLSVLLLASSSWFEKNALTKVRATGKLVVLTINGPTTYYEGAAGAAGFEHDLAQAFAEYLGVRLAVIVEKNFHELLPRIARGDADLAAAGTTVTASRATLVRFAAPYQEIQQQVIHRRGSERPAAVKDLIGRELVVLAGTSFVERLNQLKEEYPALKWKESTEHGLEELLILVSQGLIDLTVADSNIVAVVRQFYPELQVAFNLQTPERLAWAFPPGDDDSLRDAVGRFLRDMRRSGELDRLIERYYGPASRFDYIDIATYQRRIEDTLPRYAEVFKKAAKDNALDWRLLAAMAYQESHWNPEAVSPTGVRGIMQLTEQTSAHLAITNRLDPETSILGGARYLRMLRDKLPPAIEEPDRSWMALAAYNVGIGHLEDARIITQGQGGDPNKWIDVQERLPLLSRAAWYANTRHGYARGYEPVQYVARVRTFFDILVRIDEEKKQQTTPGALKIDPHAL